MSGEQLDDGSLVINFDMSDDDEIVQQGGYVIVRQEDSGYSIACVNAQGDIVNEYKMDYTEAYQIGGEDGSKE